MKHIIQVRNMVLGKGLPKICIPLTDTDFHSLRQSAQDILESPFDLVEWRADFYGDFCDEEARNKALRMLRDVLKDTPILFTVRTKEEGGQAEISAEDYETINRSVIESGLADLIDVELMKGPDVMTHLCIAAHQTQITDSSGAASCVKIVASKHDFETTPPEMEIVNSLCTMQELGADVAKYAVMPNSERDVLTLLSATLTMKEHHNHTPVITMSMGKLGACSRVCGSLFGSCVTFGTAGPASAPGQLPADILTSFLQRLEV